MAQAVIAVMNNKFPCGGGKAVPLVLDFGTSGSSPGASQPINLMQIAQAGQITDIQSFFIDNADNAAPLILTGGALNHRIKIPANSQAWINMLLDQQPIVNASTTLAAGLVVTLFACNFPTTNAVWKSQ